MGLALAADGSLYIADTQNNAIRHILAAGNQMSLFAGTGLAANPGPSASGPALSSTLNGPAAVAVAPNGDVYIADTQNHLIRKVDGGGTMTVVLGSGVSGLGPDGPAGPGTAISYPSGLAFDSAGALFFSDNGNGRVRRFFNGQLTTVAAGLADPRHLTVGQQGDLFVAGGSDNRVWSLAGCGLVGGPMAYPVCQAGALGAEAARAGIKASPTVDEAAQQSFVVAPNPALSGGDLCLYFKAAPLSCQWQVYNMAGEEVLKAAFFGRSQQCVANSLAPGVYLVEVKEQGFSGTSHTSLRKFAVIH